jgi:hypothetical protein
LTAVLSAVEALAPDLALEMAPVHVNAVTPGLIDTPLLHTAYGPEWETLVQNWAALLPGKRVGTMGEVAQVILTLMTNDDMTGEVVHVDGGGGLDHRVDHPMSFRLTRYSLWRTERHRGDLNGFQYRGKHGPGLLPEKPLCGCGPVRALEQEVVDAVRHSRLRGLSRPRSSWLRNDR